MKKIAAAGALLFLAACSSQAATPPAHTAPSRNVMACQHFNAQGKKYAANATPTLADIALVVGWVKEDETLAIDPALRRAFRHWVSDANGLLSGHKPADNPKKAVATACARYGVKV